MNSELPYPRKQSKDTMREETSAIGLAVSLS